jgi:DNA-repair protein complementing XP-A cells
MAVSGQKRTYSAMASANTPSTLRDATNNNKLNGRPNEATASKDPIQPARKFAQYVDYDFSKMTDTKGGFLSVEDDPHNKAMYIPSEEGKPENMTLKEWERLQALKKMKEQKTGKYEPSLSILSDKQHKTCHECGSVEIDFKWDDIFNCQVCNTCKDKFPDKYSLLTKTEVRDDYLLTDPELKDEDILPHLERPNPHKATWNNMMLFLRYQVEEYAFSAKKWGSTEALDEAFEKREQQKKKRKEDKFNSKLKELRKKTRVEAWRRNQRNREDGEGGGGQFGDKLRDDGKHEHEWGAAVLNPDSGETVKQCVECGMEVEELEF